MKYVFLTGCFVFAFICKGQNLNKCLINDAENKVMSLDEVKGKQKLIESLTNNQRGISFISDSTLVEGKSFYEIQVGYNSDLRFENYYIFYVEKGNCNNIKILDPVEGDIISLNEWRRENEIKTGSVKK